MDELLKHIIVGICVLVFFACAVVPLFDKKRYRGVCKYWHEFDDSNGHLYEWCRFFCEKSPNCINCDYWVG